MKIIEITVTLENIPEISRTLLVPAELKLDRLHLTLQNAMGWKNCHLYSFETRDTRWIEEDKSIKDTDLPVNKGTLADAIAHAQGNPIIYIHIYDFGDDWIHHITIGASISAEADIVYPKLTKGSGACPPEDIGGVRGYYAFLEAMSDPKHPNHEELKDWYGEVFSPEINILELQIMVDRMARRWQPRKKKQKEQ